MWGGARDANVIEQSIHELRSTFGEARGEPKYIQTVHGVGYRFIAPLEVGEAEALASGAGRADTEPGATGGGPAGRRQGQKWLIPLGLGLIGLGALLFYFQRRQPVPAPPSFHLVAAGRSLQAISASGAVAWSYTMPHEALALPPEQAARHVRFADLDGDGAPDHVIFVAPWADRAPGPLGDHVYCFTLDGKLQWDYAPAFNVQFLKQSYAGPWRISDILIHGSNVWLAVNHETWWPAFAVRLAGGKSDVMFVNSGAIFDLAVLSRAGHDLVLMAGVNNEYEAAMMAAVDEQGPPAVSPQSLASAFRCQSCGGAETSYYFLFPKVEFASLDRAAPPYNLGRTLQVGDSILELEVEESREASSFYRFTTALEPLNFAVSDGYLKQHDLFHKAGRIPHPASQCRYLTQPRVIQRFRAGAGWQTISVPPEK